MDETPIKCEPLVVTNAKDELYTEIEIYFPAIKPEGLDTIGQCADSHIIKEEVEEDKKKSINTPCASENKKHKVTNSEDDSDKHAILKCNKRKAFTCSQCKSVFTQKSCLNRHISTHIGVKPFSCTQCSSTFYRQIHLDSHILTHTGDKPH